MRDTLLLLRLLLLCWPRKLKVGRPPELLLLVLVELCDVRVVLWLVSLWQWQN